jgi:proteic killer suppression protein
MARYKFGFPPALYHETIHFCEAAVIRSYRDKMTEAVARAEAPKGFPADMLKHALNKLTVLEYATDLDDLRSPPGNRLEELSGDREGQHSIRINDQ